MLHYRTILTRAGEHKLRVGLQKSVVLMGAVVVGGGGGGGGEETVKGGRCNQTHALLNLVLPACVIVSD